MKRILIFILCLIMCFLSACAPESAETTGTNEPNENNDKLGENGDSSCGISSVQFKSIDYLKKALIAAEGTEESFDEFCSQSPYGTSMLVTNTQMMRSLKEKILISATPFVKGDITAAACDCRYTESTDCFFISYDIDDILYDFRYFYSPSQVTFPEREIVVKDYQIGPYTMNLLYGEVYYEGRITLENAVLSVLIRTDSPPPDASDLFEFKPLDLSTPTE